jgi:acetyl-CoA carboxylase biotin carboxylase subunit
MDSYLNVSPYYGAAEITNADAIHPGMDFLPRTPNLPRYVRIMVLNLWAHTGYDQCMGDKITAKETMTRAGVPVVPGSGACWKVWNRQRTGSKCVAIPYT